MSLRTYPLIVHPAYQELIAASLVFGKSAERAAELDVVFTVPPLRDTREIGNYLGISPEIIWSVLTLNHKAYRHFEVRKRSGGVRRISAPRTYLKVIQWWILDTILPAAKISDKAYGFVRGRSFVDNAEHHLGSNYILNVDIKDFFPSVSFVRVVSLFRELGYDPHVANGLAKLTTMFNGLPQGAPTSPAIANAICLSLDSELDELAYSLGMKYSRDADDITFSSSRKMPASLLPTLVETIGRHGFNLNDAKTRFMGKNQRKEITGLVLGQSAVAVDRKYLNSLRGWTHALEVSNVPNPSDFERLRGTLEFVRMVGGRGSSAILQHGDRALAKMKRLLSESAI